MVEVCLIHYMSYSFAIHSATFFVQILIVDEFLLSDGIVVHINGPEYDNGSKQTYFSLELGC